MPTVRAYCIALKDEMKSMSVRGRRAFYYKITKGSKASGEVINYYFPYWNDSPPSPPCAGPIILKDMLRKDRPKKIKPQSKHGPCNMARTSSLCVKVKLGLRCGCSCHGVPPASD